MSISIYCWTKQGKMKFSPSFISSSIPDSICYLILCSALRSLCSASRCQSAHVRHGGGGGVTHPTRSTDKLWLSYKQGDSDHNGSIATCNSHLLCVCMRGQSGGGGASDTAQVSLITVTSSIQFLIMYEIITRL